MEEKKKYSKPHLNVIGTIEEITQGTKVTGTQDTMGSEFPPNV